MDAVEILAHHFRSSDKRWRNDEDVGAHGFSAFNLQQTPEIIICPINGNFHSHKFIYTAAFDSLNRFKWPKTNRQLQPSMR